MFEDIESPRESVGEESRHLVVCEDGEALAQVVAATYAFAIDAGFLLIPEFPEDESDAVLEELYGLMEQPRPTARLDRLRTVLRDHLGSLNVSGKQLTFVTRKIPWGLAFPHEVSTHLFRYPHLGVAIANAIAGEQEQAPGIRSAVVIAPHGAESPDSRAALTHLTAAGVVSKGLRGRVATVYQASKTIAMYPYDFLLIASHCADAPGYRCTYEFVDDDGKSRCLVVDEAACVELEHEHTADSDRVHVTVFHGFVSLDGVDWSDREGKASLTVGSALKTWIRLRGAAVIEPSRREPIDRVRSSAALRMSDGNFLAMPHDLASSGTPIVINNACGSWHRLAETFIASGARCYVGTLFSVLDAEAEEVVSRLFDRLLGIELSSALARAQAGVYGSAHRRPYVMVGCHFQRIHKRTASDPLPYVMRSLDEIRRYWQERLREPDLTEETVRTLQRMLDFLQAEIAAINSVREQRAFRH